MQKIPLGTSQYFRYSSGNPSILTRNVYFESDPTNQIDQMSFIRRPGLIELVTVGAGEIRKIFYRRDLFSNDFFVVSGQTLRRIDRTGDATFGSTTITGTLAATGDISMTASSTALFITDGDKLWQTNGTAAIAEVVTPGNVEISKLAYIGGYVICVQESSQRFYWIEPGDITIDALNFAEAEGAPDGITAVVVLGDQIYFFGKDTVEVWYLSGDSAAPFQRLQGKLMETGCLENAACRIAGQDNFFFIASDGTARLGSNLERVSTPGMEERFRRAIRDINIANN